MMHINVLADAWTTPTGSQYLLSMHARWRSLGGARSLRGAIHNDTCAIFTARAGSQYAYMEDLWQLDKSPGPIP